ncbi:MAG: radical SAM protein, partial [Acidimicrobiales bacterium]
EALAAALPEADQVAGFGVAVQLSRRPAGPPPPRLDLLNLPRPPSRAPWAYVKVAEGCDRRCGFCAIPSFRGRQRSRPPEAVLAEVEALGVQEVVLVAQDLASYGRDVDGLAPGAIIPLVEAVAARVPRTRLLYLYPSDLSDGLIEVIGGVSGVAYFDLSLQHVSGSLLRRMRRWGDGARFLRRIEAIRGRFPEAAFRSSFIVGYPGETEADHDQLLRFLGEAALDWAGFFAYSREDGTYAASLGGGVDDALVAERLLELGEVQDAVTAGRRRRLVGQPVEVLIDRPGTGRSHREAPEIDGVVQVPPELAPGSFATVVVRGAYGPDLEAA